MTTNQHTNPSTGTPVVRRPGGRSPNGTGRTRTRTFRSPDARWDTAMQVAHARGESLASVLNAALDAYIAAHRTP